MTNLNCLCPAVSGITNVQTTKAHGNWSAAFNLLIARKYGPNAVFDEPVLSVVSKVSPANCLYSVDCTKSLF